MQWLMGAPNIKLQLFPHGQVMDNEHNCCMCCVLCTTVWWICAQLIAKSEEVMRLLPQGKVGLPGQREASTHYATRSLRGRKSDVTINCNPLQVISCHLMILEWQRRERMPGAGDQELECSPVVSKNYLWRTRAVKIKIYQGWCRYKLCGFWPGWIWLCQ